MGMVVEGAGARPVWASSKRYLAAVVAARLGILRAIQQSRANRSLLVLAYHRIGDPAACPLDEDVFCATPGGLRDHVRILKRWSSIAELGEVEERYASGRSFDRPLALLTFDDVYRDNYEVAFPLLREEGASAVFFVPTGLIEQGHVPWWDRIAYAVKRSRVPGCTLDYPEGFRLTGLQSDPFAAVLEVLRRYKSDPDLDKPRFVEALERATGAAAAGAAEVGELFCTWSQLREMVAGGMTVGSHTHTHRLLAHLPYPEQYRELATSREVLRERLGVEASSVAYPVGSQEHFNDGTRRAMSELGYRLGFSHYGGWNAAPTDRYDIRRVRVDFNFDTRLLHAAIAAPALFAP